MKDKLKFVILWFCGIGLSFFLMCSGQAVLQILSLLFAGIAWGFFLKKVNLQNTWKPWQIVVIGASALVAIRCNFNGFDDKIANLVFFKDHSIWIARGIAGIIVIMSVIALTVLLMWFWNNMISLWKKYWKKADRIDKRYLIIGSIVALVCIATLYVCTDAFSDSGVKYDLIYMSDTGDLAQNNVWLFVNHAENDIRQPLFGVFALPFSAFAKGISYFLFFIPNSYYILENTVQVILLLMTAVMLAKMLKLKGHAKILFLLCHTFSYTFLLFALNMEQYIFVVFYLVLFLFLLIEKEDEKNLVIPSVAATGCLITTGVVMLLTKKKIGLIEWVKTVFVRGCVFLGILGMFGQIPNLFDLNRLKFLLGFSSYGEEISCTFREKLMQFIHFVKCIYVKPSTYIEENCYRMETVGAVSVIGIVILICVIAGFLCNRKDRFAQICMFWTVFSFLILVVAGWGAPENGMNLYALYFGWAYTALLALLLRFALRKNKKVLVIAGYVLTGLFIIINSAGIWDLIAFGISNYPV